MKTVLGWLLWFLGIAVFFLVAYLLGSTGRLVRKGVEVKRALRKARLDASKQGMIPNEKWYVYRRKSTIWILMPTLGWIIFYIILYFFIPTKFFLLSLIALVIPILGYFGIFFTPSDDPSGYID